MFIYSVLCICLYPRHNKTTNKSQTLSSFTRIKKAKACLSVCLLLCKYLSRNHSEWVQASCHESIPLCALSQRTVESVLNIYSESRLFHRNQTHAHFYLKRETESHSPLIHIIKPTKLDFLHTQTLRKTIYLFRSTAKHNRAKTMFKDLKMQIR